MPTRRHLLTCTTLALLAPALTWAQELPAMKSDAIVHSLSKDIVLDPNPSPARPLSQSSRNLVPDAPRPRPMPTAPASVYLNVPFAFDSANLTQAGLRQLDELGRALNHPALNGWGFELVGHTDSKGDPDYNARLSLLRAQAVQGYLVYTHGVAPQRLVALGMGDSQLADPHRPTAGINRRVEVRRIPIGAQSQHQIVPQPQTAQPVFAPAYPPAYAPAQPSGGRLITTP